MHDLSVAPYRQVLPNELDEARPREPHAARDMAPGQCWAFLDHGTMAEVIAEERPFALRRAAK